jgi:hypothetical protein
LGFLLAALLVSALMAFLALLRRTLRGLLTGILLSSAGIGGTVHELVPMRRPENLEPKGGRNRYPMGSGDKAQWRRVNEEARG